MQGKLSDTQKELVRRYVQEKTVHDLGAGDLTLSKELLTLGASSVIAVDKELPKLTLRVSKGATVSAPAETPGISKVPAYFSEFKEAIDTAFVSWPVNWEVGLIPLLERARVVIYLGCNVGGTACGTPNLFNMFLGRELLAYDPHRRNSLIVLGAPLKERRKPTGEEYAALNPYKCFGFEEAESLALSGVVPYEDSVHGRF